jgi:hypothetical protein
VGEGGEMTQALYAHMNNKIKKKKTLPLVGLCCIPWILVGCILIFLRF